MRNDTSVDEIVELRLQAEAHAESRLLSALHTLWDSCSKQNTLKTNSTISDEHITHLKNITTLIDKTLKSAKRLGVDNTAFLKRLQQIQEHSHELSEHHRQCIRITRKKVPHPINVILKSFYGEPILDAARPDKPKTEAPPLSEVKDKIENALSKQGLGPLFNNRSRRIADEGDEIESRLEDAIKNFWSLNPQRHIRLLRRFKSWLDSMGK